MYSDDLSHIHHHGFTRLASDIAPELLSLLRRQRVHGRAGRPAVIVEVGCGSGVLAQRLVAAGCSVFGLDQSAAMIRIARATAPGARFRVASLERARLPRADAVVAIGEIVTYVPGGLAALEPFFRRVRRALRPGGLFIFDFIESAERRTYRRRTFGGDGWSLMLSASTDRSGRVLTRRIAMRRRVNGRERRSSETHRVRIYSRKEIGQALADAGFTFTMGRTLGRYRLIAGDVAVVAR